jgi:hypothetical protein
MPDDRTEQVQSRYPGTMKIGFIGAKRRDHEVSILLPSPKPCNHHTALRTAVQFPRGNRLSRALGFGAIEQEGVRSCIDGLPETRGVLFLEPPDELFRSCAAPASLQARFAPLPLELTTKLTMMRPPCLGGFPGRKRMGLV